MRSAVANRYASALVDVVLAPGSPLKPEVAVEQLHAVAQLITGSVELRTALATPAIQTSRKRAVVGKLMDEIQVSKLIRNFVFVVIDHRRANMLGEIRDAFDQLLDERRGVVRAEVTSAAPLDERRGTEMESALSRLTGKRMRLRFAVDAGLLGGAVARIGSTVYDGSVRGQLQQLRRTLTEPSAE
jgi:F-type H+-transporting ATPase subunit delta